MTAYLGVLLVLSRLANSICYYPNGDTTPGDVPCDDSTIHSTCCGIGYACLSNNLCLKSRPATEEKRDDDYSRGSCTDKTWRSSSCPNFCTREEPPYNDTISDGNGMARCPGTELDMYYCLNADVANVDCANQVNVLVFPGTPSVLTTVGILGTMSSSTSSLVSVYTSILTVSLSRVSGISSPATSTSFLPPSASPTVEFSDPTVATPKSDRNRTAIGVGVGTGVAVIILGLLGVFFYRRYRRKAKYEPDIAGPATLYQDEMVNRGHLSVAKSELPAYDPIDTGTTYELQDNH